MYCVCHTTASRGPAATTRAAAPPGGSVYCPSQHLSQPRASGDHARSSSSRRLCVLRLPHDSQPRASGDHTPSSSSRRLCVLRLPHNSQPRASGDHARPTARRLGVLRLRGPAATTRAAAPSAPARRTHTGQPVTARAADPPEGSVYLLHDSQPRARRRPRAQLVQQALCSALATRMPATGQLATTRAAAPPGSVSGACHTKALCTAPAIRKPAAAQRRPRAQQLEGFVSPATRRLCVL